MVAERSHPRIGTKFGVERKEIKFIFISETECFQNCEVYFRCQPC